jgi:RimJ/RimL family protein N-acetyltransferase
MVNATLPCRTVCLEPTETEDALSLLGMWRRCSTRTRYERFLSPVRIFPSLHLTDVLVPRPGHWSWVARHEHADAIVGLASLFRTGTRTGEVGLLVEDAEQRQGIGTEMLDVIRERACRAGFDTLTADTLAEAHHVRRMLERVGPVESRRSGHTTTLTLALG